MLLLFFYLSFSSYVFDLFLLLYICGLIFVDCMFIFFQYTFKKQLTLRSKIRAKKQSCNFFKIQLLIGKGT